MSDTVARDEQARLEALDVSKSILLQAPAGSGKTTVLVCRVLALLAAGEEPEGILAITFSRKAAAEMRERVMQALRQPEHPRHTPVLRELARRALQRDRERRWDLLRNPARLRIQTFDALNQRLATQAPVQSGGGAGLGVTENAAPLYARAARRLLQSSWADAELASAARRLFEHLDNRWDEFERLLATLLEQRLQWLPPLLEHGAAELADEVERSVARLAAQAMRDCLRCCPELGSAATAQLLASAADNLVAEEPQADAATLAWRTQRAPLRAEAGELHRWRQVCRMLLTAGGEWRKPGGINRRLGVPPGDGAFRQRTLAWLGHCCDSHGLRDALLEVNSLPDLPLGADTRANLLALALLMRRAVAELNLEIASRGSADFSFVAGAARQALTAENAPTDLALRFGAALRHVLVDEFQDTSTEQSQLLAALTVDWHEGDGRTLFLVGDPMQSIYQFRAAEVGVFLQARAHGIGHVSLRPMELRQNFRSGPAAVDWVNRRIGPLFPARDDLRDAAIRFLDSASARPDIGAAVSVRASLASGDAARDRAFEARRVLDIVRAERAAAPGCSVAVLVAGRAHAVPIAARLRSAGIAVRGVKLTPLADRHCVRDLLMLARSVQHRGDRTAWLALLRSPLCGLELPELQVLAEDDARSLWERLQAPPAELPHATLRRLERLRLGLEPALCGGERHERLALRVMRVWLRLGGAELYPGEDQRADVQAALAALSAPEVEGYSGEDFAALLADLYADSSGPDDAVQILTMHSAKGLEWDVVIVPGLHRRAQQDRRRLLDWLALPREDRGIDLLFGPIDAAGEPAQRSLSAFIRRLRRRRGELEKRRLLYVTATRAKRALYWLGCAGIDADSGVPSPPGGSLLQILWPAVAAEFESVEPPDAVPDATAQESGAPLHVLQRLPLDWSPPHEAAGPRVERLPIWLRDPAAEPEYAWVGVTGRAVGTVIHAELQRHAARQRDGARRAGAEPEPTLDCCSASHYSAWLAELGVPAAERAAGAARIRRTLERTLQDPRGRWLLSHGAHREASSERRLSGLYEGEVIDIVIDRMIVDDTGTRWIVDFKTGGHEGGELQAFVESEVERYRPQLRRYAELAGRLGPEPVRCALYFPVLGVFREL